MLGTRAIVVQVQGKEALVETIGEGGCGQCSSENGCCSSKLTQLFCSKPRQFKVYNEANADIGDEVQIMLQDGLLLRISVLMYVLPLTLLLGGGLSGAYFSHDAASRDGYGAVGSLLGLVGGFVLARMLSKRYQVMAVAKFAV